MSTTLGSRHELPSRPLVPGIVSPSEMRAAELNESKQPSASGLVRLLAEDADLARAVPREEREAAMRSVLAPQFLLSVGAYERASFDPHEQHVGLLVLDGLLLREVVVAGRVCGELLEGGSLVRPWDRAGEYAPLPYDICWRVLEPARLVVLNDRFLATSARWPGVTKALIERSIERAQRLALSVAIHSLEHVELRLLVLLWHLADRFGRVTPTGTVVPLRLTHSDLGKLVGAQRPTVSRAVAALIAGGTLLRADDKSWVLVGEPPAEVRDLRRQQQRL